MPRQYTRKKKLNQPDEFISLSHRLLGYAQTHLKLLLVSIAVASGIVAVVWGWQARQESRAQAATGSLNKAIELYRQPVVAGEDKPEPTKDGTPRFNKRKDKLDAADKAFSATIKGNKGSSTAALATFMRAGVRYDSGRYADAVADYQAYLSQSDPALFSALALEGLIYAYEAQKQLDKALDAARRLSNDEGQRFRALYHEARILAQKGRQKDAIQRFRRIIKESGAPELVRNAGQRLVALENG